MRSGKKVPSAARSAKQTQELANNTPARFALWGQFRRSGARRPLSLCIALVGVCAVGSVRAAAQTLTFRAADASGEGLPGIVLVVQGAGRSENFAIVTGAGGTVSAAAPRCDICSVSAIDPKGLFAQTTTEFSAKDKMVTVEMPARPTVDFAYRPAASEVRFQIEDAQGKPLSRIPVLIREDGPDGLEVGVGVFRSNAAGEVKAWLDSGFYVVATVIAGYPEEVPFSVSLSGLADCRGANDWVVKDTASGQLLIVHFAGRRRAKP